MPPEDREVLTSLPNTRPTRRSAKRSPALGADATASAPAATSAPSSPPRTATKRQTAAKSTPRAKAAKPKAPSRPKRGTAAAKRPAGSKVGAPRDQVAPNARRRREPEAPDTVPAAGWASNEPEARKPAPGTFNTDELLGTALDAVRQIAQIGVTGARESVASLLGRIPRP